MQQQDLTGALRGLEGVEPVLSLSGRPCFSCRTICEAIFGDVLAECVRDGAVFGEVLADRQVRQAIVGMQRQLVIGHLVNRLAQCLRGHVGNVLGTHPSTALNKGMNGLLLRLRFAAMDVLLLAADKRLVALKNFASAAKRVCLGVRRQYAS
jgi:hypothetical protein